MPNLPTSTRRRTIWGWAAVIAALIVAFVLVYPLFVAEEAEEAEQLETTERVAEEGQLEYGDIYETTEPETSETAQR